MVFLLVSLGFLHVGLKLVLFIFLPGQSLLVGDACMLSLPHLKVAFVYIASFETCKSYHKENNN